MAKHSERFTHQTKTKGVLACTPEATGTHCSTALERALETGKSERVSGAGMKMGIFHSVQTVALVRQNLGKTRTQ